MYAAEQFSCAFISPHPKHPPVRVDRQRREGKGNQNKTDAPKGRRKSAKGALFWLKQTIFLFGT